MSGAENGAERAENRLERSGAVSGQNLPLKIRSTIKPLKVKSSKSILEVTTKLSVLIHYYFVCCVENKSDYLAKEHTSVMPSYGLGKCRTIGPIESITIILFVGIRYSMRDLLPDLNNYAKN